ncbi:hypothetical protein [Flavobacterium piscis]|uniref:hypothetical protein n=1 Tax=Flavobacterium piscis TaxID=1114874 RepID=UPI00286CF218|nr:hypothetical protein [Flavobacterium piscis]
MSKNKGQKIKLNLLDNENYELVFYYGKYEIKGDSLLFEKKTKSEVPFDLKYGFDKNSKSKKVKIKFLEAFYYSFYIGTQNENETVQYQRISDIEKKMNSEVEEINLDFEINKSEYLYLVYEDYDGKSTISKYRIPNNVSEITIKYQPDIIGDLNINGFIDNKTNELILADKWGKNLLVFYNQKSAPVDEKATILPLENKELLNWTYPGKEPLISEDFGTEIVVDSTATIVQGYPVPDYSFKFKIEDNLKSAISLTKSKFLVVYTDSKNNAAKAQFDTFIKDQETDVSYSMYESYKPEYDLFNYYLASEEDKKWLKINKINEEPSIVVLNGNGEILATAKSTLWDKKSKLNHYDDFNKSLKRLDALQRFNGVVKNKKASDSDLIMAFNIAATVNLPYDYDSNNDESNPADFKLKKVNLNKKEVAESWNKLITGHQKDTKPNMYLVEAILKEITNRGFSKLFFNEEKVLNSTDFLSIDYLIKHYDAIDQARLEFNNKEAETHAIGDLSAEIAIALEQYSSNLQNDISSGKLSQDRINSVYKKLIGEGKGGFDIYKNYLAFLNSEAEAKGTDSEYIKEFDVYFDKYLVAEKGNPIQRLDEIYATLDPGSDYAYNGWNSFKLYHSDLSNNVAWLVVLKPQNSLFLKKAIIWSEYSLTVSKNNPYYLDTLAQLYYKDGQKEKAIATQEKALQFSSTVFEQETLNDMKEVLAKMQNGTY